MNVMMIVWLSKQTCLWFVNSLHTKSSWASASLGLRELRIWRPRAKEEVSPPGGERRWLPGGDGWDGWRRRGEGISGKAPLLGLERPDSVWMTLPMRCLWIKFKSSPGDDVEVSCRNQPCLSSHPRQVPVEVNSVAEFNLGGGNQWEVEAWKRSRVGWGRCRWCLEEAAKPIVQLPSWVLQVHGLCSSYICKSFAQSINAI